MTPFVIAADQPAEHRGVLPGAADVVVIGGGIIGVSTAWHLARQGLRVVLLEKGRVAGEQSSRNWGWVRAQGRDAAELPIMLEARDLWREIERESGDVGLRTCGVTYLASRASDMAEYEAFLPLARAHGMDTRLLSSVEAGAMFDGAARVWAGGICTPSDMAAEPFVAVPAMARAAVRAGVIIREGCAARAIDVAAGRVAGVICEAGRVAAPSVVVAGGAWSSLLLRKHGIDIPQLSVRATVAMTAPMPEVTNGAAADRHLAFRRRADGGYTLAPGTFHEFLIGPDAFRHLSSFYKLFMQEPLETRLVPMAPRGYPDGWGTARKWEVDGISPFEAVRVLDPRPHAPTLRRLIAQFAEVFPQAGPVKIARAWGGMIDSMPDLVPVVDRAEALPGLVIATGMSGHGFGIGPAFGRIAAALVTGGAVGHDIARFRLSRFGDGSRVAQGPKM